jgi:tryptophan-rich sensory protein
MSRFTVILLCFGLPLLAGAIGGVAAANVPEFYESLARPQWAPPAWVFGPVWIALYLMMGAAAYFVWRAPGSKVALAFFFVHLIFNAAWSWLFFFWRMPGWAFADIMLLWAMIGALFVWFGRIKREGALLLLPYWIWVTYAAVLNLDLWQRNFW